MNKPATPTPRRSPLASFGLIILGAAFALGMLGFILAACFEFLHR
jgi:hypothetical protein